MIFLKMKYSISPEYALRGWKHLPYAYVNLRTGNVYFIPRKDFLFLLKCDGIHDVSSEDDKINKYIKKTLIYQSSRTLCEEQLYKLYSTRFVKQAHWAITNKCNYKCKHCFISAPHFNKQDISFDKCCKIIDELYSCGIHKLSITGGEPLIRKDFIDILKYAKEKNIIITDLYSNGSLISESLLSKIQAIDINPIFHISYDGENTHNWMRGISCAENQVKSAIKILKKHGHIVHVSCSIYNDNIISLVNNIRHFSLLGVDKINFGLINQIGEWKNSQCDKIAKIEDILEHIISVLPTIIAMNLPIDVNIAGFVNIYSNSSYSIPEAKMNMNREQLHNWICCESMRNTLYIDPEGKLAGCAALTDATIIRNFPNILYTPLKDILVEGHFFMDFIDQRLSKLEKVNYECIQCAFYNICHAGCRGNANEKGDFWGVDSVACTFFKKGYYAKIVEIMESLAIPKAPET